MLNFFLGPFLTWLPVVFYIIVFVLAVFGNKILIRYSLGKKFFNLVALVIVFRLLYAGLLTGSQYYIWSQQGFTKLLLPPHQSISYFLGYALLHFWLEQLLAIAGGLVFYVFLTFLRKYKNSWLEREEIALGFLMALLVGWPNVVIFIPLLFLLSVLLSIVYIFVLDNKYTSLYPALILAGILAFIFGNAIIEKLYLTVLKV